MRNICLAMCVIGLAASPASAHWQYTKWGMTPDQVVAASSGAVRLSAGTKEKAEEGYDIGVEGTYSVGSVPLSATFYFKNGGLQLVSLTAESDPTCYALGSRLGGEYGAPAGSQNAGFFQKKNWKDEERGNRVEFFSTGDYCSIKYTSLSAPKDSAL